MLTKHLEVSTWTDESKIEENTTALEWARKSRFIPRLFLTLSMLTVTPTLITSCTDDPNEPDNPEVIDERDLQIRFTSGNIDISQSPTIKIEGNTLQVWYNTIAERSKNTPHKEVKIFYSPDKSFTNATEIHNWTILTDNMEWNYIWLKVTYTNWKEKEWRSTWKLTDNITSQIERLKNLNYKVDEPIDLTLWGTLNIIKASFELDWETIDLNQSNAIFPRPWTWTLNVKYQNTNWSTKDYSFNINVKPLEYMGWVEIKNLSPTQELPIIRQVVDWDINFYDHIKQLWIPWAIRAIKMMKKYGTKNLSPEQYKQHMLSLKPVMIWENPIWFNSNDYNILSNWLWNNPSNHAHKWMYMMKTLLPNEIKPNVINSWSFNEDFSLLKNLAENNPDILYIVCVSAWNGINETQFNTRNRYYLRECAKLNNVLILWSWSNIERIDWEIKNQLNQYKIPLDTINKNSIYTRASNARGKYDNNNETNNIHITIPTNSVWKRNVWNSWGKFPNWFAEGKNGVLFSWRAFATHNAETWRIEAEETLSSSMTNFFNECLSSLAYLLSPQSKNTKELIENLKTSEDTDYISLNWKTVELPLINLWKLLINNFTPKNLPTEIRPWEIIPLESPYCLGFFNWPWVEIYINWDWVVCDKLNENIIKSQNPSTIKQRLNGDLCVKTWNLWKTIQLKYYILDDDFSNCAYKGDEDNWINFPIKVMK